MFAFWALLGLIVVSLLYAISAYNGLIRLRNNRENSFADIDVQLKQRHDLIPQLLNAVKGFMKHEEGVLTKVTQARTKAVNASNINDKIAAEKQLTTALSGLQIAVEAYPDLKANQNFMQLQEEISDIENKIAATRRFFNSATKELNNSVQVFPSNLIANMFGFKIEEFFEIDDSKRAEVEEAPKVEF